MSLSPLIYRFMNFCTSFFETLHSCNSQTAICLINYSIQIIELYFLFYKIIKAQNIHVYRSIWVTIVSAASLLLCGQHYYQQPCFHLHYKSAITQSFLLTSSVQSLRTSDSQPTQIYVHGFCTTVLWNIYIPVLVK